jgi:hypothetical protein
VQRLLHGVHHPRLARIDVGREVVHEVVFGQPSETLLVDVKVRSRRGRRSLFLQGSDRFALVKPEASDVDQSDDIRRVFTERRDDLTPYECPTTTVGPSWRASTSLSRATSSASFVSGNCGAVTW